VRQTQKKELVFFYKLFAHFIKTKPFASLFFQQLVCGD
jgi:hypothetical protein